jgi:hypothetical protein
MFSAVTYLLLWGSDCGSFMWPSPPMGPIYETLTFIMIHCVHV